MDENPYLGWGLMSVELTDQAVLNPYFVSLSEPLSDYTFSQLYTWRNSLRILWKEIDGHLCVFANGTGDLTLLMPPIGDTGTDRALRSAFELMDAYNAAHGVPDRSRVEYSSEELLSRFDRAELQIRPMGADYVYDVHRMIDLAGGDLASKRQAKNRFLRNYEHRVEPYSAAFHRDDCLRLLDTWKLHQDAHHLEEPSSSAIKRAKESIATATCLDSVDLLGLKGMVVYVKEGSGGEEPEARSQKPEEIASQARPLKEQSQIANRKSQISSTQSSVLRPQSSAQHSAFSIQHSPWVLRAFTFGETLGRSQSSITIEKTDLTIKGLAQFIFSEFCRTHWAHLPLVNVGDDWGLESLAWTKQSYRPVKMLRKFVLRRQPAIVSPTGIDLSPVPAQIEFPPTPAPVEESAVARTTIIRPALKSDLAATLELEQATFSAHAISKRQMQYLQQRGSAIFLIAEQAGKVIGDGIALVRNHKSGQTGRIYSLVVHPECRGQKVGQKLLKSLLDELAARQVTRVYLEVESVNQSAIRLYERVGFRPIGKLPNYYARGKHGLHMMYEANGSRQRAVGRGQKANREM